MYAIRHPLICHYLIYHPYIRMSLIRHPLIRQSLIRHPLIHQPLRKARAFWVCNDRTHVSLVSRGYCLYILFTELIQNGYRNIFEKVSTYAATQTKLCLIPDKDLASAAKVVATLEMVCMISNYLTG